MNIKIILFILLVCLLHTTLSQLVFPLSHRSISKAYIHALSGHQKKSHLFHNVEFINKHNGYFNKHNLQNQGQDHKQQFQTFKLKPQVAKFSLKLHISGYSYNMQIDSGSSDIFIKGQNSIGDPKKRYICGEQCINNNPHYTLGYLDGKVLTYEKKLQVELGQHKFNESILVAYSAEDNFKHDQGLIGLAYPSRKRNPNPNFIQNLINLKLIQSYAFGVNLNFQNKNRSFITFGNYDTQFIDKGQIYFFPLASHSQYMIKVDGISVGNSQILTLDQALLDTGNTCISIPHQYEQDILRQFKSNGKINSNACYFSVQQNVQMFSILRCRVTNFDILPVLSIHINGTKFQIQKDFYLQACNRKPGQQELQNPNQGEWFCQTYIQSVKRSELFLGDGFFNRFYTYFDLQNKRIGIGKNTQKNNISTIQQLEFDADYDDWKEILQNLQSTPDSMKALDNKFNKNRSLFQWIQDLFQDFLSYIDTI